VSAVTLEQRITSTLGVTDGLELSELVDLLLRNRDRLVKNMAWTEKQNADLRKRVEHLEAELEPPTSGHVSSDSQTVRATDHPAVSPVTRDDGAAATAAALPPSQMASIEAEPIDEDLWDVLHGSWAGAH